MRQTSHDATRPQYDDLAGLRFGRLVAVRRVANKGTLSAWECWCDCGSVVVVRRQDLRRGKQKSCGCKAHDNLIERNTKHGATGTRPYRIWKAMKTRCYNPRVPTFKDYGARGITVCDRWIESFAAFWADMGSSYREGLTIDRIDNDKGYRPENCRWADQKTQNRNTRQNHVVDSPLGRMTMGELAELSGLSMDTIKRRVYAGWSSDRLLDPIDKRFGRRPRADAKQSRE